MTRRYRMITTSDGWDDANSPLYFLPQRAEGGYFGYHALIARVPGPRHIPCHPVSANTTSKLFMHLSSLLAFWANFSFLPIRMCANRLAMESRIASCSFLSFLVFAASSKTLAFPESICRSRSLIYRIWSFFAWGTYSKPAMVDRSLAWYSALAMMPSGASMF